MNAPTITFNNFVRRQVADSRFSHTTLSDDEVLARLYANFDNAKPGYREGVCLVPVDPQGFYSAVVDLHEGDVLSGTYEARREGETPRLNVGLKVDDYESRKPQAVACDIVLYASTVLAEDGDNELRAVPGNWEIVSINPRMSEGDEPLKVGTLMANHFQDSGGTATGMSDSEFVAALAVSRTYWNGKTSLA